MKLTSVQKRILNESQIQQSITHVKQAIQDMPAELEHDLLQLANQYQYSSDIEEINYYLGDADFSRASEKEFIDFVKDRKPVLQVDLGDPTLESVRQLKYPSVDLGQFGYLFYQPKYHQLVNQTVNFWKQLGKFPTDDPGILHHYTRGLLFGYHPQHVFKFLVNRDVAIQNFQTPFHSIEEPATGKIAHKARISPDDWQNKYQDYHPQSRINEVD